MESETAWGTRRRGRWKKAYLDQQGGRMRHHHFLATVICHSAMLKSAIIRSLEDWNIETKSACEDCSESCSCEASDVAIIVSGFCGDPAQLSCLQRIRSHPTEKWIVLTSDQCDPLVLALASKGAEVCVVPDDINGDDLANVAHLAARGNRVTLGRFYQGCTATEMEKIQNAHLDVQQWRILNYLARGASNKVIARIEKTTEASVKGRIRGLLDRLGVENRTQAAVIAVRAGLGGQCQDRNEPPFIPALSAGIKVPEITTMN